MQCLRLQTHNEHLPHAFNACKRCLTSFVWSGWADEAITTASPPQLMSRISNSCTGKNCLCCLAENDAIIDQCLRLQTHNECFPHAFKACKQWLTYFVSYQMKPSPMRLQPSCWGRFSNSCSGKNWICCSA